MFKKSLFHILFSFSLFAFAQEPLTINIGWLEPEATLLSNMIKKVFHHANIPVQTQVLPNKRAVLNANSGTNDGDATRIWNINKFYPNLLRIPVATHSLQLIALSRKKYPIKKFSDIKGLNVGVIRGMKIAGVKALENNPKSLVKASDYKSLLQMLISGRIDLIISEKTRIIYEVSQRKSQIFYLYNKPLLEVPLYIHLHKKHQGYIEKLTASAKILKKEITHEREKFYTLIKSKLFKNVILIK